MGWWSGQRLNLRVESQKKIELKQPAAGGFFCYNYIHCVKRTHRENVFLNINYQFRQMYFDFHLQ